MPDQEQETIMTLARRPVDCPPKLLKEFISIVMLSGEVPLDNLKRGVPAAEMLLFVGTNKAIMGVTAFRYAQKNYHKYLFEQAGVPEMFNPDAVEACWLSVNPKYRGLGIWNKLKALRQEFMRGRPTFGVVRQANTIGETGGSRIVGKPFKASGRDHLITLVVQNHDTVYDPNKQFWYGYKNS